MAKKKRLAGSWLSVPVWIITGLSIFILFSALYDLLVADVSNMRFILMIASGGILLITVLLHLTSLKFVGRQARKQLGG